MNSRYRVTPERNVYGAMPPKAERVLTPMMALKAFSIIFLMLFTLFAVLFSMAPVQAATVVLDGFRGELSETRGFERSGPYKSQRTAIPIGANSAYHQGRTANVFEDAGKGEITFKVKADSNGRARIAFQDVGDTANFRSFAINGEAVQLPSQRRNAGWITAELDFGVGGLGWHQVRATTTLRPGLSAKRQDGFGACKSRGKR